MNKSKIRIGLIVFLIIIIFLVCFFIFRYRWNILKSGYTTINISITNTLEHPVYINNLEYTGISGYDDLKTVYYLSVPEINLFYYPSNIKYDFSFKVDPGVKTTQRKIKGTIADDAVFVFYYTDVPLNPEAFEEYKNIIEKQGKISTGYLKDKIIWFTIN